MRASGLLELPDSCELVWAGRKEADPSRDPDGRLNSCSLLGIPVNAPPLFLYFGPQFINLLRATLENSFPEPALGGWDPWAPHPCKRLGG